MIFDDYEFLMLNEELNNLKTKVRVSIVLSDDNQIINKTGLSFFRFIGVNNCLQIVNQNNSLMSLEEMKKIISFLEYTIYSINKQIINCEKEIYKLIEDYRNKQKQPKRPSASEVYLLLLGENGRYKIGYSKDEESRVKNLALSSCENHTLVHKFKVFNHLQ